MFDRERLRQAMGEFARTFLITFAPLAIAFWNGMHTGDTVVIPNYGTVRAFLTSAGSASVLAGLKAIAWYFTGTKVVPNHSSVGDTPGKTAVLIDDR
jgi:hypothetical protein